MRILTSYIVALCSRVISKEVLKYFTNDKTPAILLTRTFLKKRKCMYSVKKKASLHLFNNIFLGQ